jgi:N-acetyl-beta-hexosaminidase
MGKPWAVSENIPFETLGVMYDCSRNSVPTVKTLKAIIRRMALMGYNALMLYTEDTYTVESRPEFGHYRGRYSPEELRTIDDYAYMLGIELIPCIQTLAHLERFLRWPVTADIRDNDYILLAEDQNVYALIEDMILSVSGCVRSNRVHLGLDEAHGLGLGRYLGKHGYKKPEEIMKTHLNVIKDICLRHHLKP